MDLFVCRLCLSGQKLTNLLNNDLLSHSVSEYLSINVARNDGLPTVICDECEITIKNWIDYTSKVRKIQIRLAENLKKTAMMTATKSKRNTVKRKLTKFESPKKELEQRRADLNVTSSFGIRKYLSPSKVNLHSNSDAVTSNKFDEHNARENGIIIPQPPATKRSAGERVVHINVPHDIRKYLSPRKSGDTGFQEKMLPSSDDYQPDEDSEDVFITPPRRSRNNDISQRRRPSATITATAVAASTPVAVTTSNPTAIAVTTSNPTAIAVTASNPTAIAVTASGPKAIASIIKSEVVHRRLKWHPEGSFCKACNVKLTKRELFVKHINSKQHRDNSKQHRIRSTISQPYKCILCNKPLANQHELDTHPCKKTKYQPFRYKCSYCEFGYTNKRAFLKHVKDNHNIKLNPADVKPELIKPSSSSGSSVINNRNRKDDVSSTVVIDLTKSSQENDDNNEQNLAASFKCEYCTFKSCDFNKLSNHELTCNKARTTTDVNDEVVVRYNNVPKNNNKNNNNISVDNDKNTNIDASSNGVDNSTINHHQSLRSGNDENDDDKVPCSQCHLKFSTKYKCSLHYRDLHLNLKKTEKVCMDCRLVFENDTVYKNHRAKIHSRVKKNITYQCAMCHEIFATLATMKKHKSEVHSSLVVSGNEENIVVKHVGVRRRTSNSAENNNNNNNNQQVVVNRNATTAIPSVSKRKINWNLSPSSNHGDNNNNDKSSFPVNGDSFKMDNNNNAAGKDFLKRCDNCTAKLSNKQMKFHKKHCANFKIVGESGNEESVRMCPKCKGISTSLKKLVTHCWRLCGYRPVKSDLIKQRSELNNITTTTSPVRNSSSPEITVVTSTTTNRVTYNCEYCQKTCKSKHGLTRHFKICTNKFDKTYCDSCQTVFENGLDLVRHKKVYHEIQTITSAVATGICRRTTEITNSTTTGGNKSLPSSSNDSFTNGTGRNRGSYKNSSYSNLASSPTKKKKGTFFSCRYCAQWFRLEIELKNHVMSTHRTLILNK